ncbi:MAG: response regulator transcription factor [Elusimicrobia bacterium]|nr:response regulator transcription factor [Elusimicrobiota bacterium]
MTAGARVLLVEDEGAIAAVVRESLEQAGYEVRHAADADAAFSLLEREPFDIVLLDIRLPGIPGTKLLEIWRADARTAGLPILMLTALADPAQKAKGLRAGADDYLAKPFATEELLARVEALLRRSRRPEQGPGGLLAGGGISVDLARREASVKGRRIALRPLEFNLLALLMRRSGFALTYAGLSEQLSEGGRLMTSDNLYAHVKNLRHALGRAAGSIVTVHGIGYKFAPPDDSSR